MSFINDLLLTYRKIFFSHPWLLAVVFILAVLGYTTLLVNVAPGFLDFYPFDVLAPKPRISIRISPTEQYTSILVKRIAITNLSETTLRSVKITIRSRVKEFQTSVIPEVPCRTSTFTSSDGNLIDVVCNTFVGKQSAEVRLISSIDAAPAGPVVVEVVANYGHDRIVGDSEISSW